MRPKYLELIVGVFMVLGAASLLIMAYRVSHFSTISTAQSYEIKAEFDHIGNLKVRSPVKMAGVKIGEITAIQLDPASFRAVVVMRISKENDKIPTDSTARILTAGLLGSNYISITPGYGEDGLAYLADGGVLEDTYSAIILENLIGKFLFNLDNTKNKKL